MYNEWVNNTEPTLVVSLNLT